MRPFQQLRLWFRSGPTAERTATGVVGLLVVALVVWAAAPTGSPAVTDLAGTTGGSTSGSGSGGAAATGTTGQPAPGTSGSGTGTTGSVSTTGGTSGSAVGTGGSGTATSGSGGSGAGASTGTGGTTGPAVSNCPSGSTDQGVTSSQITLGVIVPDLGPANETIGLPSKADAEKAYNAVFADVNKRGGVRCRKLVGKYYAANPVDASSEHAACLDIEQDKVFAVLNNMFNVQEQSCVPRLKIPNFWYTPPATSLVKAYSPYIISYQPDYERLIKYYIRGANEVGWFKGAGKIGILESDCVAENIGIIKRELTQIGFPSSRWSEYNYGCPPNGVGTPDKQTAAVLQFKNAGVTHVVSVAYAQSTQFSRAADNQDYTPKFAVMDDAQVSATDRASTSAGESFDGALDITPSQIGAENTPGSKYSEATTRCRAIMKAAGLVDPVDPLSGNTGPLNGGACAQVGLFVAAAANAPTLTRSALGAGLARAGELDLSFPSGPARITNPKIPTGGNFWRTGAYRHSCNCWVVTSSRWRPGFD